MKSEIGAVGLAPREGVARPMASICGLFFFAASAPLSALASLDVARGLSERRVAPA